MSSNGINGYSNGANGYSNDGHSDEANGHSDAVTLVSSHSDETRLVNGHSNGVNGQSNETAVEYTIRVALDLARNSNGQHDPAIDQYLHRAVTDLWYRVCRAPNTYIFTEQEFSLFNYSRLDFWGSAIAQRAVARYWDNHVTYEDFSRSRGNSASGANGFYGARQGAGEERT